MNDKFDFCRPSHVMIYVFSIRAGKNVLVPIKERRDFKTEGKLE